MKKLAKNLILIITALVFAVWVYCYPVTYIAASANFNSYMEQYNIPKEDITYRKSHKSYMLEAVGITVEYKGDPDNQYTYYYDVGQFSNNMPRYATIRYRNEYTNTGWHHLPENLRYDVKYPPVTQTMDYSKKPETFSPEYIEVKANRQAYFLAEETSVAFTLPIDATLIERNSKENNLVKFLPGFTGPDKVYEITQAGKTIGAIGYVRYSLNSNPPRLMDIYGEVALPNNYNFSLEDEYYKQVKDNGNTVSATTKVYYSPQICRELGYGDGTHYNDGILAHNPDRMLFVAFDISADYFTAEQQEEIARNLEIKPEVNYNK